MHKRRRSLALDLLLGAAAGAAGTFLMDRFTTLAYERESKATQEREENARGDKTAFVKAAQKLGAPEEQQEALGQAIHWSIGVGAGALYGVLRNRMRKLGLGSGLAYGAVFWLLMDEGANTLLKLTPPPQRFPWQAHARGLAGHLVLGGAIEVAFDAVDLATSA